MRRVGWSLSAFSCSLLIIFTIPQLLVCYNVDTDYPIEFAGDDNSYFGYSVAILKGKGKNWLIVGAPKANSKELSSVNEPGQILKCEIKLFGKTSCSPLFSDITEGGEPKLGRTDNSWLGVSIDSTPVDNGRVVACAHRWINQSVPETHQINRWGYPVRGICYTMNSDLNENSLEILSPLLHRGNQYMFSQLGISAQFIKNSDTVFMGAPGSDSYNWIGTAVFIKRHINSYENPTILDAATTVEYNSYFGYGITSGNFAMGEGVLFAIGAPRQGYFGEVYIVTARAYKSYDVRVSMAGEQLGEYFGSSLCAVDVNNDGLDDLLVGAPQHSKTVDEGKVYVYINRGSLQLQSIDQGLMGSAVPYARFGSAIVNIGDINMDSYPDVAIGAPYENERGAVYIYHGTENGFSPQFQKIVSPDSSPYAKGFGMAISRAVDVDRNHYPDIAIGSFNSDRAFLFRSRPIVYLKGTLKSDVSSINMRSKTCPIGREKYSCFKILVCLSYNGTHVASNLKINMTLEVDLQKEVNRERVLIKIENNILNAKRILNREITLNLNKPTCNPYEIIALKPPYDFLTPIQIQLTYEMISDKSTKTFCPTCPMVDKEKDNRKLIIGRFLKHCGEDNDMCTTDLRLKARFKDIDDVLIIGTREKVALELEVFNAAEPAYATRVIVQLPKWMSVERPPNNCFFVVEEKADSHLDCILANPAWQNDTISLVINLNIQKLPLQTGSFNVSINATSDSSETNMKDNYVRLSLPVMVQADITVIGSSPENRQVLYLKDKDGKIPQGMSANISHSYEILNIGPSTVNSITIEVRYPFRHNQDINSSMEIISIERRNGLKGAVFGSCDDDWYRSPAIPESVDLEKEAELRYRRLQRDAGDDFNNAHINESAELSTFKDYYQMNCSNFQCRTLKCTVGPFEKKATAVLTVIFNVDLSKLRFLSEGFEGITITSEGLVSVSPPNIQPIQHASDKSTASTHIKPVDVPVSLPIASWIIPVSIVGGFLLLILLSVALVKLGFFRRKNKEDLEKLKDSYGDPNTSPGGGEQSSPPDQSYQQSSPPEQGYNSGGSTSQP